MDNRIREPADDIPLVSVIINFLDAERFLREAIDSVFSQTWPRWELLLVDDGSSDSSTAVARDVAAAHPGRVCYLEHQGHARLGMSASRNAGVARSQGSYLAFLDSDDVFLPEKLERQVAFLESHPDIGAVFSESMFWFSWSGDPADAARDYPRHLKLAENTTFEPGQLNWRLLRARAVPAATCGVLVRRTAFDRIGGFEASFPGMFEDQVFFYKLCLHCRTHMMSGIWDRYRQHQDSYCARATRGALSDGMEPPVTRRQFHDWFAVYLRRQPRLQLRLGTLIIMQRWRQRHAVAAQAVKRRLSPAVGMLRRCLTLLGATRVFMNSRLNLRKRP